jgi:hypothetical protein
MLFIKLISKYSIFILNLLQLNILNYILFINLDAFLFIIYSIFRDFGIFRIISWINID